MTDPTLLAAGALFITAALVVLRLASSLRSAEQAPAAAGSAPGSLVDARALVVDRTSKLVERGDGRGLKSRLEQSGSQLRSGEWVLIVAALAAIPALGAYFVGGPYASTILLIGVPLMAHFVLNYRVSRRQQAFADQLPDLLQNLSSALRSGQSLPQSIASIAPDLDAPAGDELRRVVIENRIGRDLIESFKDLAKRMGSDDFEWVVRAMEINRNTGGDLSVILRRLDATIRARNHVAGTVRSLSAEGRISAVLLIALTPTMAFGVQMINPGFLEPLHTTIQGQVLLGVAALLLVVGGLWLSRLAKFKY